QAASAAGRPHLSALAGAAESVAGQRGTARRRRRWIGHARDRHTVRRRDSASHGADAGDHQRAHAGIARSDDADSSGGQREDELILRLSPELAVMFAPARSYARLMDAPADITVVKALRRPALVALVLAASVTLSATGRADA